MKQKSKVLTTARKWAAVGCVLAGFTIAIEATPQDAAAATKKADKPNIVLINMDNFGYGELGCYGGATPRIAANARTQGCDVTLYFNDGMWHVSIGSGTGVPELQQPYDEMIRFFKKHLKIWVPAGRAQAVDCR